MNGGNQDRPIQSFSVRVDSTGSGFLLVRGMEAFELDTVGVAIWQRCDGQTTVSEIAEALTQEFNVEEPTARADTIRFVSALRDAGLLE